MFKKILAMLKKPPIAPTSSPQKSSKQPKKVESTRIGELGEYKINIQLDQLPKDCKYLSDLLVSNPKSRTGYSQIDHLVISPYGLFVIETKNYSGEIKGKRDDKNWLVNNRFTMFNPLRQNYGHMKAIESITQSYKKLNFISMISFTMRCRFSIDPELRQISSNELIIYDVELTEFISRKLIRLSAENPEPFLKNEDIIHIYNLLVKANIMDPKIRNEHVEKASNKKQKSVGGEIC
ncbi:nuclease-related domain-containing protein [Paenibacillus sp. GP183]|uniref:nuclease-related domain-containing protein n=1 Tax=Paenibacillus sp. GP183 TaxID=1882751 RepID=UPI00089D3965|nr:nuclease-related domain-containing protein [Paenibacillus sp. GP183]SEB99610.1 Nuclease-related domain-containing protein [Paenibacillus sp. GP183]